MTIQNVLIGCVCKTVLDRQSTTIKFLFKIEVCTIEQIILSTFHKKSMVVKKLFKLNKESGSELDRKIKRK